MRVLVFDLDETLCDLAKPILEENVQLLKTLEIKGNMIAICSGKPVYYLCGLARQIGLNKPILIGENGAVIQFGVDLPPKAYYVVSKQISTIKKLQIIKNEMQEIFANRLWFQPNEVGLTPFPYDDKTFEEVKTYLLKKDLTDCSIYEQSDCFDIVPNDVSKYYGLVYLSQILKLSSNDFIAIGNGVNDYPMFAFSQYSIGIKVLDRSKVDYYFDDINEALKFLLNF